jgi:hypothetical protein
MFAGFSFGATVRSFGGAFVSAFAAFAGAFLLGGMAAARVFRVGAWMGDGAAGGRNARRRGRGFGGKDVYFWDVWLIGGSHAQKNSCCEAPVLLLGSKLRRQFLRRAGVSPFSMPPPKMLSEPLSKAPVKILIGVSSLYYSVIFQQHYSKKV